ncbi:MAG: hypothetical protein KIT22_12635 [Verrucomicrobiae bacterium]|nr:hypothetical protein [Verrucomicrobiae bacterium]
MSDNLAAAVMARGSQFMYRTFEGIKNVPLSIDDDFKGLGVIIAAGFANRLHDLSGSLFTSGSAGRGLQFAGRQLCNLLGLA